MVGVGLGLQDPYPNFYRGGPLGMKGVLSFSTFGMVYLIHVAYTEGCPPEGVLDDFWH